MIIITTTSARDAREDEIKIDSYKQAVALKKRDAYWAIRTAITDNFDGNDEVFTEFIAGFISSLVDMNWISLNNSYELVAELSEMSNTKNKRMSKKVRKTKAKGKKVRRG